MFGVLATGFAVLLGFIALNPWSVAMFRTMKTIEPATAAEQSAFFADSGERAVVQAMLIGSVVAVMVATMLLLQILDRPYRPGLGELRPVAMEPILGLIEQARTVLGEDGPLPCDPEGRSR